MTATLVAPKALSQPDAGDAFAIDHADAAQRGAKGGGDDPKAAWPEAKRGTALVVALNPGDTLFVPAAWALSLEPRTSAHDAKDHLLWVTKFWKTTNRDVAHFVPHDLLAGDPEDPVALS